MASEFDAVIPGFLAEADDALTSAEHAFRLLERGAKTGAIDEAFRQVHSIKGNAAALGLRPFSELAHVLEELLERVGGGAVPVTPSVIAILFTSLDALRELLPRAVPAVAPVAVLSAGRSLGARSTLRVDLKRLDSMLKLKEASIVPPERSRRPEPPPAPSWRLR